MTKIDNYKRLRKTPKTLVMESICPLCAKHRIGIRCECGYWFHYIENPLLVEESGK